MAGIAGNPYLILIILAIHIGFNQGISAIIQKHILENHVGDNRYKATVLSMKSQVTSILQIIFSFTMGYIMSISYSLGYIFVGILSLVGGIIIWHFLKKTLK